MHTKSKQNKTSPPAYPKVYESFREPWEMDINKQSEPFCFNGQVGVRRYRTTVELIDEPLEVIHERLERLWLMCDNHHHWIPLQNEAKKYGHIFKGERGSLRQGKK